MGRIPEQQDEQSEVDDLQKRGYEILTHLVPTLRTWFQERLLETTEDPMLFTKMATVALLNSAAVVGVDVGMSKAQFLAVCSSCYEDANVRAPRFS